MFYLFYSAHGPRIACFLFIAKQHDVADGGTSLSGFPFVSSREREKVLRTPLRPELFCQELDASVSPLSVG